LSNKERYNFALRLKFWSARFAFGFIVLLVISALTADQLARADDGLLVKYGPNTIGIENNAFKPPGFIDEYKGIRNPHYLGTDGRGRDVASILIHGARTSLILGLLASLLAIIFGSFLGVVSSYYGNRTLKAHPFSIILFILVAPFIIYFAGEVSWAVVNNGLVFNYLKFGSLSIFGLIMTGWLINKFMSFSSRKIYLPMDSFIMRFTEVFRAVPKLFLLLSIIAFMHSQNLWTTTLVLGALGWPRILRLVRGEVMDIKEEIYVTNAKLMGQTDFNIIRRHILPNILPILLVSMTFLISGNILLESTLSFLGLGLPLDQPSWGGLLRQSREDFGAWWLALFPGLTITLTLFSLNILADRYNNSIKKDI